VNFDTEPSKSKYRYRREHTFRSTADLHKRIVSSSTMKIRLGGSLVAVLATFVTSAAAHTWIEQMSVIGSDGNYTGNAGYPRGYVERATPGFTDDDMTYLLPPDSAGRIRVDSSDLVCMPTQRKANSNSANFPSLVVQPGDYVAMKYLENGHVTLPNNQVGKPGSGGLAYVYATTSPKENQTLLDVLSWTTNNSLSTGRLLTIQNFDDGRCYQINSGPISTARQKEFPNPIPGQPGTVHEQWCETDIQVPEDVQGGSLTVYWVWQWPTLPNMDPGIPDGKDETYTTCADFHISTNSSKITATNTHESGLIVQDPQMQANKQHSVRAANQTLPINQMFLGPGNINPTTATASTTTGAGMIGNPTSSATHLTGYSTTLSLSAAPAEATTMTTTTTTVTEVTTTTDVVTVTVSPSPLPAQRRRLNGAKFRL